MFGRRFVFLVGVLVTLNLALWFAGPGLALRKALVNQLFGTEDDPGRGDRLGGPRHDDRHQTSIGASSPRSTGTDLTLKERDGRVQQIPLSSTTVVIRLGRHLPPTVLAKRWHVVVTWPATGPALSVDVEEDPGAQVSAGAAPILRP